MLAARPLQFGFIDAYPIIDQLNPKALAPAFTLLPANGVTSRHIARGSAIVLPDAQKIILDSQYSPPPFQ